MKAYILAAGKGTRLRPLTDQLAKPMIPLMNRPLVSFLLAHLRPHISHARFNVACNKQSFIRYLQGLKGVSFLDEGTDPLGSAVTLSQDRDYCKQGTTLVLCGDLLCNADIKAMIRFHEQKQALVTLAVCRVPDARSYGVVVTAEDQRILGFYEKPATPPSSFISCGIYLLSPQVFDYWQPEWTDLGSHVFPSLVALNLPLYAWLLDPLAFWSDIGTPLTYLQAHLALAAGVNHIDATAQVAATARLQQTVVGATAIIQPGVELQQCVVWPGSKVAQGTRLCNAIITPTDIVEVTSLRSGDSMNLISNQPLRPLPQSLRTSV
ncbi:sugar phosphate nucleotidyltransferase [Anthocerotibacter panamensis]|uniref:sugar phosphate nucleotidyltransferase n=1 Tax=Anthocerotibacter panamensis TaxID=2857077 RepID=UPI001C407B11|nr:sugar phosphate nucleotidyltransferase [Anthocerotibacter panamensis]